MAIVKKNTKPVEISCLERYELVEKCCVDYSNKKYLTDCVKDQKAVCGGDETEAKKENQYGMFSLNIYICVNCNMDEMAKENFLISFLEFEF